MKKKGILDNPVVVCLFLGLLVSYALLGISCLASQKERAEEKRKSDQEMQVINQKLVRAIGGLDQVSEDLKKVSFPNNAILKREEINLRPCPEKLPDSSTLKTLYFTMEDPEGTK